MKKLMSVIAAIMMALALTGCAAPVAADGAQQGGMGPTFWIVYIVLIGGMMYLLMIRPQKKQRKEQEALFSSMEIGDSVLTTAGFYGVIIDITEDTVIVEFGGNKACRIPMQKAAIVQIEKPNYGSSKED